MVPADRGTSLDRESVRVRPQGGLTRHLGECNVCEDNVTKSETKEIKDEPVADLCSIDDVGGHAKSDQYGRSVCRLRHRSARAFSRQAFLRQQDSRISRCGMPMSALPLNSGHSSRLRVCRLCAARSGRSLYSGPSRYGRSRLPQTDRRLPSDPTGTGPPHGFVLAC